jgi:hypothetical protein
MAVSFICGGNRNTWKKNHRPVASHWKTKSLNVVSSTPRHERDSNSVVDQTTTRSRPPRPQKKQGSSLSRNIVECIANSSWHWVSYGSIWTCPSPKKYYMDRSFWGPYNIFLVTDRSIYRQMTRSDMNYLIYYTFYLK